jgi:glycosyltransferase involved in cell wall biosynthesis
MASGDNLPKIAFPKLFGGNEIFGTVIYVFIIISCLGTMNGIMIGTSRGLYALAVRNQGPAPKSLVKLHEKSNMPISLVIAGRASTHIDRLRLEIEHFGMKERVHILCGVAAEDMPAIYSNAIAYLATERYASFNYHIVEALNIGTAVVAVRGTSHEEAAGPDSAYVSPDDSEELRQAIEGIAINMALREDMVAKGKAYAQRFRPEVIAYNMLKCYSRVGIDIRE